MPVTKVIPGIRFYIKVYWFEGDEVPENMHKAVVPILFEELDTAWDYLADHSDKWEIVSGENDIFIAIHSTLTDRK